MRPSALPLQPEIKDIEHFHAYFYIRHLSIFGGKGNGLEHHAGPRLADRIVIKLAWIEVVEVGVFFLLKVIQVGDFLLHLRVQISTHLVLDVLLIVGSHLFIDDLGFLHTLHERQQLSFCKHDLLLVLEEELFTLLGILWEELVLVAEGMEEHEFREVEKVRILFMLFLEKSQGPWKGPLVQDFWLPWHWIPQGQQLW